MLGLLMMAGLGFAATAIIDHMDSTTPEGPHPAEEEEAPSHGSLLDDPDTHGAVTDDHASQIHNESTAHSHGAHHGQHHGHHHAQHGDQHHPAQDHHTQAAPHHAAQSHHHEAKGHKAPAKSSRIFGGDENDTLHGSSAHDLMEGNGGDDRLSGHGGNDHLVAFDAGHDTLHGGAGNDTLHGYLVQKQAGDLSYVVEDHQADHLHGGAGRDTLFLGSDDVGTGGHGADSFHLSWDVDHGHPAEITDYNPRQDKIYVEFTSNHADENMTDIKPEEQTITTEPMQDGGGTSILINGQAVAHVLGAAHLSAADIGVIHA